MGQISFDLVGLSMVILCYIIKDFNNFLYYILRKPAVAPNGLAGRSKFSCIE